MEALDKISEGLQAVPVPDIGNVDALSKITPEARTPDVEAIFNGEMKPEATDQIRSLQTLQKVSEENSLNITRVGESARRDRADFLAARNALRMQTMEQGDLLPAERQLHELEAKQQELQQQKEQLLQAEIEEVFTENITETLAIFKKMPPEVFEVVLRTGKIPLVYKILSIILGEELEEEFVMVLAQAYQKGITSIYTITHEFPQFVALREKMKPAIMDIAAERVLHEPEQKQIENGQTAQNAIPDRKTPEAIPFAEPKQIAETAGADGTPSAPAGGASVPSPTR